MTTFVDSSAFIALLVASDPRHRDAWQCFERLRADDAGLITHSYVLVETIALVHRRYGIAGVRGLAPLIELAETRWVDEDMHRQALARLAEDDRRRASLVDQVSFGVMHDEGIVHAFAFDRDFVDAGFEVIPG